MKNYFKLLKETFEILPLKSRSHLKFIFLALSIAGILETLSLGLTIPLIAEILGTSTDFFSIKSLLGFEDFSKENIIKYLTGLIFFVYLIKAVYLSYLEIYIQRFVLRVRALVTLKLFKKYTYSSYESNINSNSSLLYRNLTSEVANFTSGIVEPIIMLAKEFFIIFVILLLLFTINIKISIFIMIFSIIFVFLAKKLLSNILKKLSYDEQNFKGKENQVILESLQGIKFIKAYNLEEIFNLKLRELLLKFVKIKSKSTTIRLLPRIWIEFVVITFLIILAFLFLYSGYTIMEYLLFSSIFLISMIKVMPSLLSALRVLNSLSSYHASINLITTEFDENYQKNYKNQNTDNIKIPKFYENFQCKNITFKYLNSEKILEDLSFEINRNNDVVGIYGESGSGKTTLVDILIGLLKTDNGNFYLDGKEVSVLDSKNIFGYVPQTIFLFDDTIKNNILMSLNKNQTVSDKFLYEVLKKTQLLDLVNSFKDKENTFIGENGAKLSGGQRQRIGIARALICNPKVLIFDEATSGLDKETEKKVFEDLKKISKDLSILIISHNPDIWNYCNKLYEMKNKNLIKIK
jgi:ATP-binding cassette, subfamily B, bacterial PglK|tara:strand:- start:275 stop:2008 length:1734 start_codon:yes stop_codon:yes gene_type:complete